MYTSTIVATLFAAAGLVAAGEYGDSGHKSHHNGTVVTTTKVVAEYTTYCPEPTTLEYNGHTYVVEEPTTLTITDCPCTVVEPCYTCNVSPPTGTPAPGPKPPLPPAPKPQPPAPKPQPNPEPQPEPVPEPKPTEVVAGAAREQALGYIAAAGMAAIGVLAL